ncbi:MAG TPA: carboxypeptidase-like regulatory domain-containing protein, partial [Chitinophagaceae bacterium]|nr:carboxypeptidase-like regulatory domain-containing protein [Chitinophagaceae bacterium]
MRMFNLFEKQKFLMWIFAACCCLLQPGVLHAQEGVRQVSGKVTDKTTGEPLQGVTIALRKGKVAVTTNRDGSFSLQVPPGENLVVSFVGYTGQEIHTDGAAFFNITLEMNYSKMDEVVVIGYGTARKKNVVGALDIVSAKDAGATTAT